MKKALISFVAALVIGTMGVSRTEDSPVGLLAEQMSARKDNPILDMLMIHFLTGAILVQSRGPSYPGDDANPRPNTPWYPHQWAAHSNRSMWDSDYQKTFSGTLSKEVGGSPEQIRQAVSMGLNRAAYFVIATDSAASTYYPTVSKNAVWDILKPGDTIYLDDGDQNVHLVFVFSKEKDSIYILDIWPQRFFFRSTGTRVKKGLADLVKVDKDDFLEYCAQITTLDSFDFPRRFVTKYLSDSDETSRQIATVAFAVQLTNNQHLPSMRAGYDLLETVVEQQVDYGLGFELHPHDLKDFAALYLFHGYSAIFLRSKNESSRNYAREELEFLQPSLKAIESRQIELLNRLKTSHIYRLAEAASLHDLVSAEALYNLTLEKDPNHIEALAHRAATRVTLRKSKLAREDIQKTNNLLKSELERLKKMGIPKTVYEGRPDIYERNKSLEEVQRLLMSLDRELNRQKTTTD